MLRSSGSEKTSGSSWTEEAACPSSPHPAGLGCRVLTGREEGAPGAGVVHSPWSWVLGGLLAGVSVGQRLSGLLFWLCFWDQQLGGVGPALCWVPGSAWILPGTGGSFPVRAGPPAVGNPGSKKTLPHMLTLVAVTLSLPWLGSEPSVQGWASFSGPMECHALRGPLGCPSERSRLVTHLVPSPQGRTL